MEVDLKGVAKDNAKLILSLLGLIVVAIMMSMTMGSENGVFDLWNATELVDVNTDSSNSRPLVSDQPVESHSGDAIPVSNGKNNFFANEPPFDLDESLDYKAVIDTNMGNIAVDLYEDDSPNNVNNFVFLANEDFYKGTSFHRVIKDYLVQGGDPLGNGYGGPGYLLDDEIDSGFRFKPYMVAMASSGPDNNGSQFFIVSKRTDTRSLDGLYTPIGEVTSGFSVIDEIESVDVDGRYMPYEAVIIEDISISAE